jgi:Domain of unknown function (DUF4936)
VTANLYVYFKAPPDADVAPRVRAMQAELASETGVQGRVMRRRDRPETWMEVYENIGDFDGFETRLAAAADRHGVAALLQPGERRHVERFVSA